MRRILFVDADPLVLDGFKRLLRTRRSEWEMLFIPRATEALETLGSEPVDVLVSDFRMSGMDGGTLLAHVQKEFPSVVRIVLSGDTDVGVALRALPVAHQFLTKPCDPDILLEVIERAANLRLLLDDQQLRCTVGELETLPSLPRVYSELTRVLANPDANLNDVVRVVEQDVAIYAKILQLVNSSFFGLARRVTSIQHAVNTIGTAMLRNLVLSVEVFRAFDVGKAVPGFSLEKLQAHGLRVARLASRLVVDRRQTESAFVGGMLHDVGRLILVTRLPAFLSRAIAHSRETGIELHRVERELLGVTHAELGAYLLGLWGLPYPVVESVAHHHDPRRVVQSRFDVLAAVHVADQLARELDAKGTHAVDEHYLETLGMTSRLPAWRALAAEDLGA
jgi:HD-like signal output (HDOD) protein